MPSIVKAGIYVLITILMISCASKPETLEQSVIDSATDKRTLRSLYQDLQSRTQDKDKTKDRALFKQLSQVGEKLGDIVAVEVRQTLAAGKLPTEITPLSVLDQAKRESTPVKQWNLPKYDVLVREITEMEAITQAAVNQEKDQLHALGKEPSADRLRTLQQLGELTGDSTWQAQYDSELTSLEEQFHTARAEDALDKAKQIGAILESISPERQELVDQLVDVDTKLFEKKFYEALESAAPNAPDLAYNQFEELAASKHFETSRKNLTETGKTMANYFVALAKGATQSGEIGNAYQRFIQARNVKTKLDLGTLAVPEEKEFIARIAAGLNKVDAGDNPGVVLGFLYIMEQMNPRYPQLKKLIRETEESVARHAIKRVSTTAFKNAAGKHEYGNSIAAKITQYLFSEIPNDVRIVERDDYEAIQREQKLKGNTTIIAVDYLITGSVLESKVDTSEKKSRKTMRVVTEEGEKETAEYLAWLQLSEKAQKKKGKPVQFSHYEEKEDITVNIVSVRKVGIFSVSYQLIEANTGKVIFPDNITLDEEYKADGNDGVELGIFSLPYKDTDLPSDIEILDKLSTKISQEIGAKLVDRLKNPEQRYAMAAKQYIEEGNYADAAEQMSNALAIAGQKDLETDEYKHLLRLYSSYSGFAR